MTALSISHVLLWICVISLSLVVLALARQIGVLHERIAPAGALMLGQGLKIGEAAPRIEVKDLVGRSFTLGAPHAQGKNTLLMFVSPTCPVCKALLPVLKSSQHSERQRLDIVLASDGNVPEQLEFIAAQKLESFSYVLSTPLGLAYQASRLPYAVLIDSEGVLRARGIVNSREHLESLFEAQRLGVASVQDYLERHSSEKAA